MDQVYYFRDVHALSGHWWTQRGKRPAGYVCFSHALNINCTSYSIELCSAILSDITTSANRSKALAHVGIAFAICFCIGPPIGAYFASRPLPSSFRASGFELNVYATPALITLVLLVLETIFLAVALPETRGKRAQIPASEKKTSEKAATSNGNGVANGNGKANGNGTHQVIAPAAERLSILARLRRLHFLFLGLFSGVEFTLTFLTFDCEFLSSLAHIYAITYTFPSVRLEQQTERRPNRLDWYHQCSSTRRLCPSFNV